MKLKDMTIKIQNDLGNITTRRARCYVDIFHKKYNGLLDAIMSVDARYTDEGFVEISYIINGKHNSVLIDGKCSVYADEVQKRKEKKYNN